MGDRSYIVVESDHFAAPLIFYGHWSGEDASAAVTNVLSWTDRIGDPNYPLETNAHWTEAPKIYAQQVAQPFKQVWKLVTA